MPRGSETPAQAIEQLHHRRLAAAVEAHQQRVAIELQLEAVQAFEVVGAERPEHGGSSRSRRSVAETFPPLHGCQATLLMSVSAC
jgi:hypothetical protein